MSSGFYQLRVDRIYRETPDAVRIRFLVPPAFQSVFTYKAGQFLTLKMMIDGQEVRRSYSVCESPLIDPMPSVAVKEVPGGRMSTYLNRNLREGDLIEAMAPLGNFTLEPQTSSKRHVVLYGGGSGITPLYSILRTVLQFEPQSAVSLLYANRNLESIIFKDGLDALAAEFPGRLRVFYALDQAPAGWTGYSGMLNPVTLADFFGKLPVPASACDHFICGPSPMMSLIEDALTARGIPKNLIHLEYFTAVEKSHQHEFNPVQPGEIVERNIQVEVFGRKKTIRVGPDQSILEAAQDAGLDPPYSCTVGVCTTCRAKLRSGQVHMDEREGLSDAEINEGFVLTCQSHPLSDDVDLVYE